jgi:hypothetical protein
MSATVTVLATATNNATKTTAATTTNLNAVIICSLNYQLDPVSHCSYSIAPVLGLVNSPANTHTAHMVIWLLVSLLVWLIVY